MQPEHEASSMAKAIDMTIAPSPIGDFLAVREISEALTELG